MKSLLSLLFALALGYGVCAQNKNNLTGANAPDWTRLLQLNTFGTQNGVAVSADNNNVYMSGSITGELTYEGINFTSVGVRDLLLTKISNTGNTSWVKQISTQAGGFISPEAIKIDTNENIYIVGTFSGSALIGSNTITCFDSTKSFIAKFDSNGTGLWATSYLQTGTGTSRIAVDSLGSVYIISRTTKLIKFNKDGLLQWEQNYPDNTLQAIAISGPNLFLGGALQIGITTFGTINLWGSVSNKAFLAKADLNGVFINAMQDKSKIISHSTKGGQYRATGIFVHPTAGTRVINTYKILLGTSENELQTSIGDLTNNSGFLNLTINPDNTVSFDSSELYSPLTPITAAPLSENKYYPDSGVFHLNYEYSISGAKRTISETLVKLNDYLGDYSSSICDIAVNKKGDLILTGGYIQNMYLDTIKIANQVRGVYMFIAKCNINLEFSWIKTSAIVPTTAQIPELSSDFFAYRLFLNKDSFIHQYGPTNGNFNYGTMQVQSTGGQVLIDFDAEGVPLSYSNLQNTTISSFYLSPGNKLLTTGSYNNAVVPSYGNLFMKENNPDMSLVWQKQSTNSKSGTAYINYVKHDKQGNTYLHSTINGYCDYFGTILDGEVSATVISKLDVTGKLLWLQSMNDYASNLDGPRFNLDKDNSIIATGTFKDSLKIGDITMVNQDLTNDQYIVKFTSEGQLEWVNQLNLSQYNVSAIELVNAVNSDNKGNIYISGVFGGKLSISDKTVWSDSTNAVFIAQFDAAGKCSWLKSFPIKGALYRAMVSSDANGYIYLAADIDDGTTLYFENISPPQINQDAGTVLVKMNSNGTPLWANLYGGLQGSSTYPGWPVDLKTDSAGNSYVWGICSNNAVFGATILTNPNTTVAYNTYYLAKINTEGALVWTKGIYNSNNYGNYRDLLDIDTNGNAYVGGNFYGKTTIEGVDYTCDGVYNFMVIKYSSDGEFQWIKFIPSSTWTINAISVFKTDILSLGGSAGSVLKLGNFNIIRGTGSSCMVATLGYLPTWVDKIPKLEDSDFSVYPNPNNGCFSLDLTHFYGDNIKITISNITGVVLYERRISKNEAQQIQQVNASNLSAGIYFILVESTKVNKVRSLIVNQELIEK